MSSPSPTGSEPSVVPTSVDLRGLTRVGAKLPFLDYLIAIWDFRHFAFYDARANVQTSTSSDKLGSIWLVLNPVLNGLTYLLIFGVLLQVSRGVENYIGFLIIGVFLFQMSSRAITTGARAIRANLKVVQAFDFPRASLLLAINLRELIGSVPVFLAMFILILLAPPAEVITPLWLLLPPALVLQIVFNLGVGLILARLVAKTNDLANFIPFVLRLLMYGSCVIFPISLFDPFPLLRSVIEINPLYQLLTIVREAVLYAQYPAWQSWAILAVWALGALAVGLVFFWHGEEEYGRDE